MRTIAVMNQKGGVGKTTSSVNLSAALAEMGHRVLLIDLDPQAHASLHLGIEIPSGETSVYDVLCGEASLASVCQKADDNLWVVPSNIDLASAEVELASVEGRETILSRRLADESQPYDYVIIDCPPSLGMLTINALVAVREVLLPMQPHFLALHGLSKLLRTIQLIAERMNPSLRLAGVVFCMYESGTRLAAEVRRDVDQFFQEHCGQATPWSTARVFETAVRRNIRLAEAPSFGRAIFNYAPDSNGAKDYRRLAIELVATQPNVAGTPLAAAG